MSRVMVFLSAEPTVGRPKRPTPYSPATCTACNAQAPQASAISKFDPRLCPEALARVFLWHLVSWNQSERMIDSQLAANSPTQRESPERLNPQTTNTACHRASSASLSRQSTTTSFARELWLSETRLNAHLQASKTQNPKASGSSRALLLLLGHAVKSNGQGGIHGGKPAPLRLHFVLEGQTC